MSNVRVVSAQRRRTSFVSQSVERYTYHGDSGKDRLKWTIRRFEMSATQIKTFPRQALSPHWHNPLSLGCKRAFDAVTSGLLLVLLAPLFMVLAVAVKLTSRGSVLYRWQVVGKGRFDIDAFQSSYVSE